ncbi:ABC transporter substrate-binding protein [Maridesulfovibrio sp.]|uniref:ABC transporter substrate-binding protein n=1 Tax=unclassified Maridesulfovibrio TaxID=2794999 RepID=UPI003B00C5D5
MKYQNRFFVLWGLLLCVMCILFTSCSGEKEPVKLGLLAGLSGPNADLGHAGRNGAILAVAEINKDGGVGGRQVVLRIRDDENSREKAVSAVKGLMEEKVSAIVGPFTTTMTEAVLPVTDSAGVLLFSPTASSTKFSGLDDNFMRICSTTADNAKSYADFLCADRKVRRISVALEEKNHGFVKSWLEAFKVGIKKYDTKMVSEVWYRADALHGYGHLIQELLSPAPDAILLVANAVNVARMVQQIRKVDAEIKIFAAEWAGTQQLIELGGRAVDGLEVLHLFNKYGTEKEYLRFKDEYKEKFKADPGFSSILAYESVKLLLSAMAKQKDGQLLKNAVLENSPYQGLQGEIYIDKFGDSVRKTFFVTVNGTRFAPVAR